MDRKLGLICFIALCLFASSPRASAQDAQRAATFSGVVDEHVRVGAAFANGRVMFFFCGDADTVSEETSWLTGATNTWLKGRGWSVWARVTGAQNVLDAYIVTPEGKWYRWTTPPLTDGRGLYRAVTEQGTLGAVVTDIHADGVLELQGAIRTGADQFSQIVPVSSLITPIGGELEVSVPIAGGGFTRAIVRQVDVGSF